MNIHDAHYCSVCWQGRMQAQVCHGACMLAPALPPRWGNGVTTLPGAPTYSVPLTDAEQGVL